MRRAGGRAGRRGCTPTVDLQPGPGLAEPLRSLGAEVVAQQLASGRCVWVTSLWLEDNDVGVSGAKHAPPPAAPRGQRTEVCMMASHQQHGARARGRAAPDGAQACVETSRGERRAASRK